MERGSPQARRERLTQLMPKIGPVAFARDRLLPVATALQPLLPETGLVRGSVVGCQGPTAVSVALATVAEATAEGSWLACVGLPSLGLRAAAEVGIALERLVMVAAPMAGASGPVVMGNGSSADVVASTMSALIDGFDLILLRGAAEVRPAVARRLQARITARGAVLVVVGDPGSFVCDLTLSGQDGEWEGLGDGSGRLARRRLQVSCVGRRSPRQRQVEVWLPGATGGIEAVEPTPGVAPGVAVAEAGGPVVEVMIDDFRQTG